MDEQIKAAIHSLGQAFIEFKTDYNGRLEALDTAVGRINLGGGSISRADGRSTSAVEKEHKTKFENWFRKGSDPEGLRALEIQAGLSTVSDPDGGYLVPVEMDHDLEKLAVDSVAMRRLARIVNASGDYKRPISAGGATGGWVGEKEERTETDSPELRLFSPPWSELYALPEVTQALLDMSDFDVAAWLLDELQDVETSMEGAGFIAGNGVKQPRGILSYDTIDNSNWTWGKIGYIAGGHASLLNNVDRLKSLKYSLKPIYRQSGVWLMNDTTQEVISNFKNGNGDYIWRQGLTEDAPDTLLGRPVEIDDNMPDIGAGAFPIAFGDFKSPGGHPKSPTCGHLKIPHPAAAFKT
jgi:HK97 family phage major capsid protein